MEPHTIWPIQTIHTVQRETQIKIDVPPKYSRRVGLALAKVGEYLNRMDSTRSSIVFINRGNQKIEKAKNKASATYHMYRVIER